MVVGALGADAVFMQTQDTEAAKEKAGASAQDPQPSEQPAAADQKNKFVNLEQACADACANLGNQLESSRAEALETIDQAQEALNAVQDRWPKCEVRSVFQGSLTCVCRMLTQCL